MNPECTRPKAILVIEDSSTIRALLRMYNHEKGREVFEAENGKSGLECWRKHAAEIDLVVLDLRLPIPGIDGEQVFREIRTERPQVPVIIFTSLVQPETTRDLEGCTAIVVKSGDINGILEAIENALNT